MPTNQHVLWRLGCHGMFWTLTNAMCHISYIRHNEFKAVLDIPESEILEGDLPGCQMKLVQAWIELHRDDLMADWILASSGQTPSKIDPLR